ncbi:hypothetical protein HYU18_00585 [Candidatus Woesearchaeota archaeon]|nr:hypothetical protein [Candidatus Woesearchaeota archaeon]
MAKLAKTGSRTLIRLSRPGHMPTARQFLADYFSVERPHTAHLFFSRGVIDFLLGLIIGILIGLIIAAMAT